MFSYTRHTQFSYSNTVLICLLKTQSQTAFATSDVDSNMDKQSNHAIEIPFSAIELTGSEGKIDLQDGSKSSVIGTVALIGAQDLKDVKSRAYQLEMLEESLKRNIIVAVRYGLFLSHYVVLY